MEPGEIGRSYDALAFSWQERMRDSANGMAAFERAFRFGKNFRHALDVGCGCSARLVDLLAAKGFQVDGIDVSKKMVDLARQQRPGLSFHHADICNWPLPRAYDFIAAWDSIWHLPLAAQEPVLRKLVEGLNPDGVFVFTTAGLHEPVEKLDSTMGVPVLYSTLGIPSLLILLSKLGCVCRHLEYDQHPEKHLVVIVQKTEHGPGIKATADLAPTP